jgi:L-rhamnose mutarotase
MAAWRRAAGHARSPLAQQSWSFRMTTRHAFVMKLKPGNEAIYKKKHDEIWPEMLEMMRRDGVRNYSIYRHGLLLFGYLERDKPAPAGKPTDPLIWKWWEMMAPYMETNPDFSPVQEPVEEMFYFRG